MTDIPNYVITAMTCAVIATSCNVLSTGGVYWIQHQSNRSSQGLWISCNQGRCERMTDTSKWRLSCQIISVTSCGCSIIGVLIFILTLVTEYPRYMFVMVCIVVASACSTSLLGIFANNKNVVDEYDVLLGWSYVFQCINVIFLLSSLYVMLKYHYFK